MGHFSESHEVSFTNEGSFTFRRKVGYILAFLAVASCIVVGLLVYYVGVMGIECDPTQPGQGGLYGSDQSGKVAKKKVTDVRLPLHLLPELYKVELVPFIIPGNFTIRGRLELTMSCIAISENVTLHVADMTLENKTITLVDLETNEPVEIVRHEYDLDREFYVAHVNQKLRPGRQYKITINYVAILNDKLKGFYRTSYKDLKTQNNEYAAVTQFQPTDARRAFPCFDEPALKAKFEVSLGRKKDMTSISNMPIKENGLGVPMEGTDEYVWDHYETSVPMSTYLVAFVVSKFGHEVSPDTGNGVMFRIWARRDALDQIAYAKDIGPKILKHFEEFFDIKYPLPKQDMIAIPDFSAGAMENWGLITYRETALLYKPGVSALRNKQRVAIVVSHELAHQWFGNLVTPSWWNDLWLNEGFANYVQYLGVDAVQPELKLLEQFVYLSLQSVFAIDALETSHPVSVPVKHPDEINEIFDRISYAKGASIIRMMDKFLTTNSFRRGLTNYLNAYKYTAAEQDNLWHHLTEQAHKDETLPKHMTVKKIMDTWTLQMGYPVISVDRDYEAGTASLRQERFLISKSKNSTDKHNYMWWVPITFVQPGGNFEDTYNSIWMSDTEKTKVISGMPRSDQPVIFNVQENGYYRVNYDEKNWKMIIKQLNDDHTSIHVINRAQIIDDALNLARAGLLEYDLALGVTSYLRKETEYIPWAAALDSMSYISQMLRRTAAYGSYKQYMRKIIDPLYKRVGFEAKPGNQPLDTFLRKLAISYACGLGNKDCLDKVQSSYNIWMDKINPDEDGANEIDVDLKKTVYCHAVKNGDEEEWDFAWKRYLESNVASEKRSLLIGLSCTNEIWLLNRYLNMSMTEGSGIRKADGVSVISSVAVNNNVGRDLTFDFVRENWSKVVDYFGSTSFGMTALLKNVLANRNTQFSLDELLRFERENRDTFSSGKRGVQQAIESTQGNVKWMDKNYETIFAWLKERA